MKEPRRRAGFILTEGEKRSSDKGQSSSHYLKCIDTWGSDDGDYYFDIGSWYYIKDQKGNHGHSVDYDCFYHGVLSGERCDVSSGNASYSDTLIDSAGYYEDHWDWSKAEYALFTNGDDGDMGYEIDGKYDADFAIWSDYVVFQKIS
jgi:hypothetical protein